ncbi:MAG: hypothetical protein ACOVS5_15805 [Oligoflexus sp.]|jgi:hypothetical protein
MMGLKTMSLILYTAYKSMTPCEDVFVDLAKSANPTIDFTGEQTFLSEFANAACETTNPDVLWLIAQQESNFRFVIARQNGQTAKLFQGQGALDFLQTLAQPVEQPTQNIDIGVLQFNWQWHKTAFNQDPMLALSPRKQVDYFLRTFSKEVFTRCQDQWVGCYHHPSDHQRATRYQLAVVKKGRILALQSLYFLRNHRAQLTAEERKLLPSIRKEEFYRIFQAVANLPLPRKQILHFVDDGPSSRFNMPPVPNYEG